MIGKRELFLLAAVLATACGTDADALPKLEYRFGPYQLAPGEETTDICLAATLHNKEPLYINAMYMTGAPGIHHSNWFWVPESNVVFAGFPEGTFSCASGDGAGHAFDQSSAAVFGGVLFAQSTQATSDTQVFPDGAVIRIPPNSRIVADLHLLNTSDSPESVPLSLRLDQIAEANVTTLLNGFAMENLAIALPPNQASSFTVECDLSQNAGHIPTDFRFFHSLAHYHQWGTAMTFSAIRDSDGGEDMIWSTKAIAGDELGGMLAPPFDLSGHSKLRLTCDYYNNTPNPIVWGNGGGEMCINVSYTDSPYVWTAGLVTTSDNPGTPTAGPNNSVSFTAPACTGVLAKEGN